MKKLFTLLCILSVSFFYSYSQTATAPATGNGTENDPYQISSLENLLWIAQNTSAWNKHFIQTSDIDASETSTWNGGEGWMPIGNSSIRFTGKYNGNDYAIHALYINRPGTNYQGLFGYIRDASVLNLGLTDLDITGYNYTGGLTGYSYRATIENCSSSGNLGGYQYVGGLVGYLNWYSAVNNSYSSATTGGYYMVGGLVGYSYYSPVNESHSTGNVTGTSYTGGLVGYNSTNSEISNCYSSADVSSTSGHVGGLLGRIDQASVYNSYSTGSVSGSGSVGGLIGSQWNAQVNNSFWDTETSGWTTSSGGEGKTTDEMKDFLTFVEVGWSFKAQGIEGIWNIGNERNEGYPYFDWQYPDDPGITEPFPPYVTTDKVTAITLLTATVQGTIVTPGNPAANEHGICWNASGNPTLDDNKIFLGSVTATGTFTTELPGLAGNTTYYARAFAVNSQGISYGREISFMTHTTPAGSGTVEDPYRIASLADLFWITLDNSRWNKHYLQTADIDASQTSAWDAGKGWTPIGNNSNRFTGKYDGGGHTINGIHINRPNDSYQGFFGYIQSGASIMNLGLTSMDISGGQNTGGLSGYSYNSTISNSYSSGNLSGNGSNVGGLAGYISNTSISNCYSSGNLSVIDGYYVGGLVGFNAGYSEISNSYSTADVSTTFGYVGGLVGYNEQSTVKNSYSTGSVSGSWNVGGLVGSEWNAQVNNSFWDTQTSGKTSSAGGEGKTTAEMQQFSTFSEAGWDFKGVGAEEIWNIGNSRNDGYPYLSFQYPGDPAPADLTPPAVSIESVSDVTINGATVTVMISNTGNPKASNHGICWNTTGNPSIDDNSTDLGPVVEAGQFTVELTGLEENTFYYVRAYAINSQGTSYSDAVQFAASEVPEGSGAQDDPYLIASLADLYWISTNPSEWNKHYLQTADIDASVTSIWNDGEGWMPIGNNSTRFRGSYNGDGYIIEGLFINRPEENYQGLFGYIQTGASIMNLGLTNTDITGRNYVGGLTGYSYNSTISNSFNSGAVNGNEYVGGLAGQSSWYSPISDSYSSGDVSGTYMVGGLTGYLYYSDISNSYSTGTVSGGNYYTGGLAGYSQSCTYNSSYSTSSVTGGYYLGGLIGMDYYSTINNSYSTGNVSGSWYYAGGLAGYLYNSAVNKSYSTGSVSGTGSVGGLIGYQYNSPINNSFWDTETSGRATSAGGTGKLTSQMKELATFTDTSTDGLDEAWDFTGNPNDDTGDEDHWSMDSMFNDGYPFLGWQDFIQINYYADANGSILGDSPQYVSEGGEGKPVEAVPDIGYHFTQWSDGSTENPRKDRFVFDEISVTASFGINSYTLNYGAGPNGSMSGTEVQTLNHGETGEPVEAIPDEGYYFVDWSDAGTDNPRTDFNVTGDISVFANFAIITYDLTYYAAANGSITGPNPQSVNYGDDGEEVEAVPDGGYFFSKWSDGSTENPRTDINVTEDITVTATFGNITLEYLAGPNGSISGQALQYVNSGDDGEEVEAIPDEGYYFVDWSDAGTDNPRRDLGVTDHISVTANFAIKEYTLTYDAGPNGSIDGPSPQNLSHGDDGETVEAVPDAGYLFAKWSDGSKQNPRTDKNVSGDINVTAHFGNITLTYLAGTNGSISGPTPQIINQGSSGEEVEAIPDAGYHFVNWSDGKEDNPRKDVSVTANITVTANFAINNLTLNYSAGANGTITGPVSQELEYGEDGEEVEAVAEDNYYFVKWSDGSTQNPRKDVNVTGNISVTATFAIVTYKLTYDAAANGSISGSAGQTVDHGGDGAAVEAVASRGYHFAEWSDGSTQNPRTDRNVTGDISVSASFEKSTYTLTYDAGANGSITGDTSQSLNYGENGKPVEAVPDEGYHFVEWSDGSTQNPRSDTGVTGDISVTANFSINTFTLRYLAGIHGEISGPKRQTVAYGGDGEEVEAVPNPGYRFVEWSDGSTDNPRKETLVSRNLVVSASFSFVLGITPEEEEKSFRVYPNPVTDILYIDLPNEADRKFELHHISGSVFMQGYVEDGKIDMTRVKQGVYILSINNRNIRIIKK